MFSAQRNWHDLLSFMQKFSSILLLRLAFQSLGVVFGDLGTSPLYVFYNIFPHGVDEDEDVIGALSLIIYTLTLIPLMKYVFVVLRANDNGQGEISVHHILAIIPLFVGCYDLFGVLQELWVLLSKRVYIYMFVKVCASSQRFCNFTIWFGWQNLIAKHCFSDGFVSSISTV